MSDLEAEEAAKLARSGEGQNVGFTSTPGPPPAQPVQAPAKRRHRRGRSSSERGHLFRERQRQHEIGLELQLQALQKKIQQKLFLRGVWEAKYFRTRHSVFGPLVAIVREYYEQFQHGLQPLTDRTPAEQRARIAQQEAFAASVMDPEVTTGLMEKGPQASLRQWRLHTQAYESIHCAIVGVPEVIGSGECVVVTPQVQTSALVGPSMVRVLFPARHRSRATQILGSFMGKSITFTSRSYYRFSASNQIIDEQVEIEFAQGFLDVGLSLREVVELLTLSRLALNSAIRPDDDEQSFHQRYATRDCSDRRSRPDK